MTSVTGIAVESGVGIVPELRLCPFNPLRRWAGAVEHERPEALQPAAIAEIQKLILSGVPHALAILACQPVLSKALGLSRFLLTAEALEAYHPPGKKAVGVPALAGKRKKPAKAGTPTVRFRPFQVNENLLLQLAPAGHRRDGTSGGGADGRSLRRVARRHSRHGWTIRLSFGRDRSLACEPVAAAHGRGGSAAAAARYADPFAAVRLCAGVDRGACPDERRRTRKSILRCGRSAVRAWIAVLRPEYVPTMDRTVQSYGPAVSNAQSTQIYPLPADAQIQTAQALPATWYTRVDYFHWNEKILSMDFVNESGALFTVGYQRQVGIERFRGELFGGVVDYNGYGQFDSGSFGNAEVEHRLSRPSRRIRARAALGSGTASTFSRASAAASGSATCTMARPTTAHRYSVIRKTGGLFIRTLACRRAIDSATDWSSTRKRARGRRC